MTADLISILARFNIGLAAAILVVLLLRIPVRRFFGARVAYALWIIPPLAAVMSFAPARIETVTLTAPSLSAAMTVTPPGAFAPPPAPVAALTIDLPVVMMLLWAGGLLLSLLVLAFRQHRFVKALGRLTARSEWGKRVFAAETNAGVPAVLGAVRPMIVTPADFDTHYSADERRVVIAHERAHMAQGDPMINAVAAFIQCASWFNPLAHVAMRFLRIDQELACDEAVMARPAAPKRAYAEALLKAHAASAAVPLGCAWPPPSLNALKERIAMLKRKIPSRAQVLIGVAVIALATIDVCALAWSAQPTRTVTVVTPTSAHGSASVVKHLDDGTTVYMDSDSELAGGADGHVYVDQAAIDAEVARALAEAQRDLQQSQREIQQQLRYLSQHRQEMGLTDEDMRQAQEDALQAQRDAQQAMREAQQEAQEAAREAREEAASAREEAAQERAEAIAEAQQDAADARQEALDQAQEERDAALERAEAEREAAQEQREAALEARRDVIRRNIIRINENTSAALDELQEHTDALSEAASEMVELSMEQGPDVEHQRHRLQAQMETHQARISELARQMEQAQRANSHRMRLPANTEHD